MTTDIHSCSLYCDRPGCIKAQRDQMRDEFAHPQVPLDAIQISNIAKENDIHHLEHPARMKFALQFARAIERTHGIGETK